LGPRLTICRQGDYDAASPCHHVDLPQTLLEPILVRYASSNGFTCRFDTSLLSIHREAPHKILSTVRDTATNLTYQIRSKYVFGADGGRSIVVRELDIPLIKKPKHPGIAINVLASVDLTHIMPSRWGNLHWVMSGANEEWPKWGFNACVRMVKPWTEWLFYFMPAPWAEPAYNPSQKKVLERIVEVIGDASITSKDIQIKDVSKWVINEVVAERYHDGNDVFCLGDAVHRHPPVNGLGSNTCIQDAYNLAWKIALVEQGKADPSLLDSYTVERQPVGATVIGRANQGLRDHGPIWDAIGRKGATLAERQAAWAELSEGSERGTLRRESLRKAVEWTSHALMAVGVEMNQQYDSRAVYLADEVLRPSLPEDPILHYQITTYPGSRLPHAWLNTKNPGRQFSTQDLAGKSRFCLLTGHGGRPWKEALEKVGQELGIETVSYGIGWGLDYEDVYSDWTRRREVRDAGCVLVRPDRFVAWRSMDMLDDCADKLRTVLSHILGRGPQ